MATGAGRTLAVHGDASLVRAASLVYDVPTLLLLLVLFVVLILLYKVQVLIRIYSRLPNVSPAPPAPTANAPPPPAPLPAYVLPPNIWVTRNALTKPVPRHYHTEVPATGGLACGSFQPEELIGPFKYCELCRKCSKKSL